MTIFFSGQSFKYEIEGICKLFFPVMRFEHCYDTLPTGEDDYIFTRRKRTKAYTLLWVSVLVGGKKARGAHILANDEYSENECERILSVLVYELLSKTLSVRPKWGILTGVRPVNILQKLRREGKSDSDITKYFKEKYLVSDEKLRLSFLTADAQQQILNDFTPNSYSLYVAIPFCVSRCSYCSFVSHSIERPKATDKIDEYISLLCQELKLTAEIAAECGLQLDCVYIGGGTPTAITAQQLKRVTDTIKECFPIERATEYTIEAGRADTITPEKLEVIRQSGCNRISVNPQTFNDETLVKIGRKHTAQEAENSFLLAREMGFKPINMDFIAGLPDDSLESFKATIERAVKLSPENITVHTLSIKRSADLFTQEGIAEYAASGITAEMNGFAFETLTKAGYSPYYLYRQKNTVGNLENVGYSKNGYESRYNVYIMDEMQTIIACGAGGVTKLVTQGDNPISRIFNYKYHFEYIKGFDEIINRKGMIQECLILQERNILN